MTSDDYKDLARRALLRLAPLTDDERAQIAHYQPNAGGMFIVRDAPQDVPLIARAYPDALIIHITREDMPDTVYPAGWQYEGNGLLMWM